ncbi:hypothetical protein [Archaeoglobus veneficus]|uniref:Uncharacterized protein n=1 Tax=Archaeoglobus veneficus (strain DSM 11195 / SNP6) TaxID=693661 RepID=F2KP02_ARCVS|nr:hypothetical protein [Archaeoglobus veneficus]AEA46310.1 hypothetical protein Arcve_0275 [Archaeoglobus veneficus SNP6]
MHRKTLFLVILASLVAITAIALTPTIYEQKDRVLSEEEKAKAIGDFKVQLSLLNGTNHVKAGEKVCFHVKLSYNGTSPRIIYYGHLHPFRIEVYSDGEAVAKIPEIILTVLNTRVIQPSESLESSDLCFNFEERGIYKAVAYAELAFEDPIYCQNDKQCWQRIYSNELKVVVE